jgi:hypothetical protein
VIRLVVVVLFVVTFNILKGKGSLVVIHVLLDLVPVTVAPKFERRGEDHLVQEIPLRASGTYLKRWSNEVLIWELLKVAEAGHTVIVVLAYDVKVPGELEFAAGTV